jgi:hypothetical protein
MIDRIYWTNFRARDCISQITVTNELVSSLTLLGNGFQRRKFLSIRTQFIVGWQPSHDILILWPLVSAASFRVLMIFKCQYPNSTLNYLLAYRRTDYLVLAKFTIGFASSMILFSESHETRGHSMLLSDGYGSLQTCISELNVQFNTYMVSVRIAYRTPLQTST